MVVKCGSEVCVVVKCGVVYMWCGSEVWCDVVVKCDVV